MRTFCSVSPFAKRYRGITKSASWTGGRRIAARSATRNIPRVYRPLSVGKNRRATLLFHMSTKRSASRNGGAWTLTEVPTVTTRRRGAGVVAAALLPDFLSLPDGVKIEKVLEAQPPAAAARRRDAGPPELVVESKLGPGESAVLAIRHPSGALTFHVPTEHRAAPARRGVSAAAAPAVAVFHVPVRRVEPESSARRGIVGKV